MEGIDLTTLFIGLISLITLIVFFVTAVNIGKISRNIKEINYVIKAWAIEKGLETLTICFYCRKSYIGNQKKCPHCGVEKVE